MGAILKDDDGLEMGRWSGHRLDESDMDGETCALVGW
jgi:hypothetical protein